MITQAQLLAIMPRARSRVAIYLVPLNEAMLEFGIDTPLRQCAFLATLAHESGELRYVEELASGHQYDDREDLGNTKLEAIRIATMHGSMTGPWWKGHGLIQVTGYDNHLACGKSLGIDLINMPRLLTMPTYAARSAGWFWKTHNINRYADSQDFDGVCDKVNRGRKTVKLGDSNGWKDRLGFYESAKEVLL